jgi:[ribosomal protein S5]-alanine N-acetyltransferase
MNLIIETERLFLRELLPTDDEAMFLLDSNPNVHQYLGNKPVNSIEVCREYIVNIRNQYKQNGIGRFAVVIKETHETIGWAGIKYITETENNHIDFYEIGYRLQEQHWGKGYGFEAAKAWLNYGFNQMKIKKMYASANKENAGSIKILKKIGMQYVSEFDWNGISCYWFELENKLGYDLELNF